MGAAGGRATAVGASGGMPAAERSSVRMIVRLRPSCPPVRSETLRTAAEAWVTATLWKSFMGEVGVSVSMETTSTGSPTGVVGGVPLLVLASTSGGASSSSSSDEE